MSIQKLLDRAAARTLAFVCALPARVRASTPFEHVDHDHDDTEY